MISNLFRLSYHSMPGQFHEENEDVIVAVQVKDSVLLLICDGVSSCALGGWAAQTCAEHLKEYFLKSGGLSFDNFQDALLEIDWEFRGKKRGEAACTVTVVSITKDNGWIASLGDSPIVLVQKDSVTTLMGNSENTGLRAFVGMGTYLLQSVEHLQLSMQSGDWLLLLSDGVSNTMSLEQLHSHYLTRFNKDIASKLCTIAYELDSGDDLSVVSLVREK
jgi:serine/threonine protein phosphatase PrpC